MSNHWAWHKGWQIEHNKARLQDGVRVSCPCGNETFISFTSYPYVPVPYEPALPKIYKCEGCGREFHLYLQIKTRKP